MRIQLLKPDEVDFLFRYPTGRALRLAKARKMPHIILPDGEIRFEEEQIRRLLNGQTSKGRAGGEE
jgi:hypothetical protein